MTSGVVVRGEARIPLTVRGPSGPDHAIEAVIDTGYTASLSLPPSLIAAMALRWQGIGRAALADGSECLFDVFEAEIVWDGRPRRVFVDEADTDPLVGMGLLSGYKLTIEVRAEGSVEIEALGSA